MLNPPKNQKGFAAFYITLLMMAVILGIAGSIFISTWGEQKISGNIVKSSQAYYIAEAGIEDALLRLSKNPKWVKDTGITYQLKVDDATATVKVSSIIGGSRTITSRGEVLNRIRKLGVVYEISSEVVSFYYGAQVGEGGIEMQDTSKIKGNVFSNGNVIKLSGNPEITGTVKIAKNGNRLEGLKIGQDVFVYNCLNSKILGKLTSATSTNCSAAIYENLLEEIATSSLPITEEQIQKWKNEALSGGTTTELIISGKEEVSLGPKKIEGKLIVQDNAILKVTGTLWVRDEITIQNQGRVFLDNNKYGNKSGVIISDGKITIQDNAKVSGSGETGSYLMLLSTFSNAIAITIQNSPELDIIYASQGRILLQDSIKLKEVSGWGLKLQNKATVIYESGLEDTSFTSGPGGGWEVTSWQEIE